MTASNMKELEQMLMKEMRKAMNVTAEKALADMYSETGDYYTGGEPKMYQRTGALGDSPKVTAPTVDGNEISFDAYLDLNHEYTTGKNPSMLDVLNLANYRKTSSSVGKLRKTVGKTGFWERAEDKMEKSLKDTMKMFFS